MKMIPNIPFSVEISICSTLQKVLCNVDEKVLMKGTIFLRGKAKHSVSARLNGTICFSFGNDLYTFLPREIF